MLQGLRAIVRDANFATLGVPAVVAGVSTRIIWLTPTPENTPTGNDVTRAEPRRRMAIRRDDVPAVPRGTLISVTEPTQEFPGAWRVDALEGVSSDHFRVIVVPK